MPNAVAVNRDSFVSDPKRRLSTPAYRSLGFGSPIPCPYSRKPPPLNAAKSTTMPIPVGGSSPPQSLSPPGSSAHQPSQPPAPSTTSVKNPTCADQCGRTSTRMSNWSWVAWIGTLTRIECTISFSTLSWNSRSTWMRAASAPSAEKLKPAPSVSRASRSTSNRSPSRSRDPFSPSERNQRLVITRPSPSIVPIASTLGSPSSRRCSSALTSRATMRVSYGGPKTMSGSSPFVSRAIRTVASFVVAGTGDPGRGAIAAFQVPLLPS